MKAGHQEARRRLNNTPESSCTGKIAFDDSGTAAKARDAMGRESHGKRGKRRNTIYHCDYCKKWHIGHRFKKRMTLRRRRQLFCYGDE